MKWLQLDSDTPTDPRIRAVLARFGNAGFGALVRLWCFVAAHGARPGWSLDSRGQPIPRESLVEASGVNAQEFDALVAELLRNGHISQRPWKSRGVIAFPAMQRRADTYTARQLRIKFAQASNFVQQQDKTLQDKTLQRDKKEHRAARGTPKEERKLGGNPNGFRVIARLAGLMLDEMSRPEHQTLGDLTERLKQRCAKAQLPYDSGTVARALDAALAAQKKRRHG